jgi:Zn-dependent protease
MLRSWHLGKLVGIDVYVHWTFLLLVLFVLIGQFDGGVQAAVAAVAVLIGTFGCVLLHELGHALMARRYGIPTLDITLYPIGGVARLARLGDKPWEEFWIALAGPAVNVAIAAGLGMLFLLAGEPFAPSLRSLHGGDLLRSLQVTNIILVVFNLVPAFPMDGGRVLRALLSTSLGRLRATEIAASLGSIFALVFVYLALFRGLGPMLLLVAGFTWIAGRQELAMVRHLEYRRRVAPPDVLPVEADVIDVTPRPYEPGFSGVTWDPKTGTWTVWKDGRPVRPS